MNNFKKEFSVSSGEKKDQQMEFNKRVSLAVLNALDQMETKNEEEKLMKMEYMLNLSKIINNYEDVRGILTKYFEKQQKDENGIVK